jgi:hypothetical protein
VFLNIAEYLPIADLYTISSLNKTIRYRALTTTSFQTIIRRKLLGAWAVPIQSEYPNPIPQGYAHSRAEGDWLLYGTHVFKTQSMRNRRRIFNLVNQLKSQYTKKATEAGYLDGPNSSSMKSYFATLIDQQLLIHRLNELCNYDLFVKVMEILNKAVSEDLRGPKFRGTKLPIAVDLAMGMMQGKLPVQRRNPAVPMMRRISDKIDERMKLFFLEKKVYENPRTGAPERIPQFDDEDEDESITDDGWQQPHELMAMINRRYGIGR